MRGAWPSGRAPRCRSWQRHLVVPRSAYAIATCTSQALVVVSYVIFVTALRRLADREHDGQPRDSGHPHSTGDIMRQLPAVLMILRASLRSVPEALVARRVVLLLALATLGA